MISTCVHASGWRDGIRTPGARTSGPASLRGAPSRLNLTLAGAPPVVAPPIIVSGYFKDAPVEGLSFSAGPEHGTTDADGRFTREEGGEVGFSVGGVTLASTACDTVVTPLDLFSGSTLDTPEVLNVVRFLLMLDTDGDPDNGIFIADDARSLAAGRMAVDFAASNFTAELSNIVDALTSAGKTVVLADEPAARAHLLETAACVHAGVYWLWISSGAGGESEGMLDIYPQAINGVSMIGAGGGFAYSGGADDIHYGDATRIDFADPGIAAFTAEFAGADRLVGGWNGTVRALQGERFAAGHSARYRFVHYDVNDSCSIRATTIELFDGDRAAAIDSWLPSWDFYSGIRYEGSVEGNRVILANPDLATDRFEAVLDFSVDPPVIDLDLENPSTRVGYGCKLG